jgi:hypothetical protein
LVLAERATGAVTVVPGMAISVMVVLPPLTLQDVPVLPHALENVPVSAVGAVAVIVTFGVVPVSIDVAP